MQNGLPAGWRVSNSSGSYSAPRHHVEQDLDDLDYLKIDDGHVAEDGLDDEDLRPDSPGWEDVEEEVDETSFKCLICDNTFGNARKLVQHGQDSHDLDLDKIRKGSNLNFYETMQLINYIRSEVRLGTTQFDFAAGSATIDKIKDQKYMQPTLDNDALLYSVDELADPHDAKDPLTAERESEAEKAAAAAGGGDAELAEGTGNRVIAERALR